MSEQPPETQHDVVLGAALRRARNARGLSLAPVAEATGASESPARSAPAAGPRRARRRAVSPKAVRSRRTLTLRHGKLSSPTGWTVRLFFGAGIAQVNSRTTRRVSCASFGGQCSSGSGWPPCWPPFRSSSPVGFGSPAQRQKTWSRSRRASPWSSALDPAPEADSPERRHNVHGDEPGDHQSRLRVLGKKTLQIAPGKSAVC